MSICIIGFLAIRRRRSRKSNRPGIPRVTEKSVVFNKLRCESMRNGSTSFPMCGSSHIGHHFSDDTEHAYSSDNEVIYEEIDNKIVRFPEKEDLMVKLVPQNIYVNNNNNPGISGMANGAANDQKRRHSLPNDIYTTAGPSTHNPHYQEV
ncbi:uncharacterized protein LOC106878046 [Octopus bimaculoides]|nr:uncharacterized protein LOC106878046 [Octopus bimaculoides]|eukprot:XP_014782621.1 PREDICTED: uncharacterized protein LOC106878046 [Octopus bimaculoides]